ncbi:MAG: hypothetical protein CMO81_04125 [Waddliaceae bacterium]|nr:hypothetical protein [Waddliaceae bacterium]
MNYRVIFLYFLSCVSSFSIFADVILVKMELFNPSTEKWEEVIDRYDGGKNPAEVQGFELETSGIIRDIRAPSDFSAYLQEKGTNWHAKVEILQQPLNISVPALDDQFNYNSVVTYAYGSERVDKLYIKQLPGAWGITRAFFMQNGKPKAFYTFDYRGSIHKTYDAETRARFEFGLVFYIHRKFIELRRGKTGFPQRHDHWLRTGKWELALR